MSSKLALGVVAAIALAAAADALRGGEREQPAARADALRIDLASSRSATPVPAERVHAAFPGAISKVAASDETTAVAVSHVPGDERARAAIQLWRDGRLVGAFRVPAGSFSRGLWFTDGGEAIATVGWNGRGYLWSLRGRELEQEAYFAYETR